MIFAGLCATCRYHRWIVSGRGSRFLFCDLSRSDPAFAKYPPLPVLGCPGFEPAPDGNVVDGGAPSGRAAGDAPGAPPADEEDAG
jgi:hypothetical protein